MAENTSMFRFARYVGGLIPEMRTVDEFKFKRENGDGSSYGSPDKAGPRNLRSRYSSGFLE
jgi:hypothetical protein